MKRSYVFLVLVICCVLLSACGELEGVVSSTANGSVGGGTYQDIVVEAEQKMEVTQGDGIRIGLQFYQDNPVQLFAQPQKSDEMGIITEVYVKKEDGSNVQILQHTPWMGDSGYVGTDGCFYTWNTQNLKKINQSGEVVFELDLKTLNMSVRDICQLQDGTIYLLIFDYTNGTMTNGTKLVQMDEDTGEMTQVNTISRTDIGTISKGGIAAGQDGLIIMTAEGIWSLNVENGSKKSVFAFTGSSFILENDIRVSDFRVIEDKAEILRANGTLEMLQRTDVSIDYIPIVVRGIGFTNNLTGNWLKERITEFNQENGTYFVVLEECDPDTELEDYARLTSVEISTGKGPDILYGHIVDDYIYGMIEKGAFADFAPCMESYGIKKEDYFPCAFNCWGDGDKIYGINFFTKLIGFHIDESILGGRQVPDVETLVNALLDWQGSAVFIEGYDSADIMENLLMGSDTLWGMVDWDKRSCDFDVELFAKMLEMAERYGDDETNGLDAIAEMSICGDYYGFEGEAYRARTGKSACGVLFDEGCDGAMPTDWTLAVNSNSQNVEGAWEFIAYLLAEESQVLFGHDILPVHRGAFQTLADEAPDPKIEVYSKGVKLEKANADEVKEMVKAIENAKPFPIRTVPIIDIICEEAEDYFNGTKNDTEVIAIIENRVQLYLDEQQ